MTHTAFSRFLAILALALAGALCAPPAAASAAHVGRNHDGRAAANLGFHQPPNELQQHAIERLRGELPELAVTFDPATGAVRTLSNTTGFLTEARAGADPHGIALEYVQDHLALLGLEAGDLDDYEVTDSVYSKIDGTTHLYLRQRHLGIPVYNGQLQVNVAREGRVLSVNNAFQPSLWRSIDTTEPALSAADAVLRAARSVGIAIERAPRTLDKPQGARRSTAIDPAGISAAPIEARLAWLPIRAEDARLVWNFQIATADGDHWWDLTVDAADGTVWTRIDWVADASYRVYPRPVESPNHTTPLPPSDGRVLVANPQSSAVNASPQGWHSTGSTSWTVHRGNNVHAYDDRDANGAPPAGEPNCGGSLVCDFAINLGGAPSTYTSAAVTNLFYWNNLVHDIQYQYGFNEAAGNFQVNNFGKGGAGNDDVRAEAQDGSGTNNANFLTLPDGQRPRMQMYEWLDANPDRDSDLDALVIVHEYGHGISNRQVGGPSNTSCLGNAQQPGEGWSDWLGLVYTTKAGSVGTTGRGVGTYLKNQATTGPGIRAQRYSTDQSINNWTYASISGAAIPHGVGAVWAQVLWEVHWALVAQHGWDANLYNAGGGKGNQRAMLYVNQGMKNTVCSPTFINARDGIIQAATANHGGADVCLLWQTFAAFGLGTDASTPGPSSTSATNGFGIPASCGGSPGVPAVPASLTVINERCFALNTAEWAASSGATTYELYRSPSSTFTTQTLEFSGSGTFDVVNATSTTYLRVRACNSSGCSGYRNGNQPATYFNGCL